MRIKDDQKTEAIYKATLALIQQMGFGGITMAKIAKEAGIATGTLYIYFKNKEELINSLYLHLKRKEASDLFENVNLNDPLKVLLKQVFVNALKGMISASAEMVFMEQYYRSPYIEKAVHTEAIQLLEPLFTIIERGKKEHLIKDINIELIMAYVVGGICEFAAVIQHKEVVLDDVNIDTMFAMLWDGIKS